MDTAFGDNHTVAGDLFRQRQGGVQAGLEGMQVAVVDADQLGVEIHRPLQLFLGMYFHQHIAASLLGGVVELVHLFIRQGRRDQQNGVGPHGPGLEDLPGVDHEVLAQHRQIDRVTCCTQVMLITLEEVLVGEHRQTGRAVFLVAAGNLHRIEIITDHTLAGGGLLDFGDHCRLVVTHPVKQAGNESPGLALVGGHGLQLTQGVVVLADRNFFLLAGNDLVENGACAHNRSPYQSAAVRAVLY